MKYHQMKQATFIERPNRFIAYCEVDGKTEKVHVKNTGRCKELLPSGGTVYLEESDKPGRKTKYSLIASLKKLSDGRQLLINMDSQAPNQVVEEALKDGSMTLPGIEEAFTLIKREVTYGDSRFDFYLETDQDKIFMEVKGGTLEEEGVVRFPDAPTERGVKHLEELLRAHEEGYKCFVLFVIPMAEAKYFTPHEERHPAFAVALRKAAAAGVGVLAYTCEVTPDTLKIAKPLPVKLIETK